MRDDIAITYRMYKFFIERTKKHISLVNLFLNKILELDIKDINKEILLDESYLHDSDKFADPEFAPYVLLTWRYLLRNTDPTFDYPQEIQDKINEATLHHITTNKHHPEFWSKQKDSKMLNTENRDEPPEEMIDATDMPLSYVACMTADWLAMAKEKGTNPNDWADKNVNVRWEFTEDQKNLIYALLRELYDGN